MTRWVLLRALSNYHTTERLISVTSVAQNKGTTMSLEGTMLKAAMAPIDSLPMFQAGDLVKVEDWVTDDGQTPEYWGGETCECISRSVGGMLVKRWVYKLKHPNGRTCEFQEHELAKP